MIMSLDTDAVVSQEAQVVLQGGVGQPNMSDGVKSELKRCWDAFLLAFYGKED